MSQVVPEVFKLQDTVYHYCHTITALEHILFKNQLRLSPRKASIDPIEHLNIKINQSVRGYNENIHRIEAATKDDLSKIKLELKEKYLHAKQLCFCKNQTSENFEGRTSLPLEYYGFLKPRMWDQYADRYNGVCLSFSRKRLEEIHSTHNDVEYVGYDRLSFNRISLDGNNLLSSGYNEYSIQCHEKLKRIFYRKHVDYKGENEFRMLSFSKEEYQYIDISDAINGIIVSRLNLSDFAKKQLTDYATNAGIQLIYLDWSNSWISITTKESDENIYETMVYSLGKNRTPPN